MIPRQTFDKSSPADEPEHDALTLTGGGNLARIRLGEQVYTLRITRAGKLILTK
jgi:hemin uptake protein HemP